jgi:tetratricopeptide (TPR) repeat protein
MGTTALAPFPQSRSAPDVSAPRTGPPKALPPSTTTNNLQEKRVRTPILCLLACMAAAPLAAQRVRVHDVPARPALFAGADTNSASAYYILGTQELSRDPAKAAAAFYWSYRLNPRSADALYGRRVALLLSDKSRLVRYMDGTRNVIRSAEVQAIDSLHLRALTIDPFLVQKFDREILTAWLTESVNDEMRGQGASNAALASHIVRTWMMSANADPLMKAWFAYSEGRFPQAIDEYERALRRARYKSRWRTDLGRLHFLSGNHEKAIEHFTTAIQEMRDEDERGVVYVYQSKALLEQSVGAVYEKMGDRQAAKVAYGRALTEDLAYYPAHQRLGMIAWAEGDTATALAELALAAEAAAGDGAVQLDYGGVLALAGRHDEALAALQKAIAAEPYFAEPYLVLASVHDLRGSPDALTYYREFLARATRDHPRRAPVEARLSELSPAAPSQ